MRTETINIYTFDELSDKAKDRARGWWRQGALDYGWWECIYEDAERIGLKISGFDTGRSCEIEGNFIGTPEETAEKILAEDGEGWADLVAESRAYKKTLAEFMATAEKDEDGELATYALEADREDIDKEFLYALLQGFLSELRDEAEHLQSDEVADEMITVNEYEFTEDGGIA
jgi:hypothetical protein